MFDTIMMVFDTSEIDSDQHCANHFREGVRLFK